MRDHGGSGTSERSGTGPTTLRKDHAAVSLGPGDGLGERRLA